MNTDKCCKCNDASCSCGCNGNHSGLKKVLTLGVLAGIGWMIYKKRSQHDELPTAQEVDLRKYMGVWFEIARLPQRFEKGATHVTAEYTLTDDGAVIVENRSIQAVTGEKNYIKGKAWVDDPEDTSKLKVQFQWPIKSPYWILEVAKDYSYALVGTPDRKSLWILARKPNLKDKIYIELYQKAQSLGFEVEKLHRTIQE